MKASLRIAGAALIVLGIFAGLASAETPDACGEWSCAKLFSVPNHDYAFVDGVLTSSPVDEVDTWKSNDPAAGDKLLLYLDGTSYQNDVTAQLWSTSTGGDTVLLMQQISKLYGNAEYSRYLTKAPTFVKVFRTPSGYSYTFVLSRNV